MTEDFDLRLVAYNVFDTRLGVLPAALEFTYAYEQYGLFPTLDITYAKQSTRSQWLEGKKAVAVEVWDGTTWTEKRNSRLLVIGRKWDRVDKTQVRTYRCYGLGWLLTRMKIFDESAHDAADGPKFPTRKWNSPTAGNLLVPTCNAARARGFTPYFDDPWDIDFTLDEDCDGVEWDTDVIPGKVERRITEPLSNLVELCVATGIAHPWWSSRRFKLSKWGTLGANLTDSVFIRDGQLTASPESRQDDDLAARILAVGEQGQFLVVDNTGSAELGYGALEHAVGASGLTYDGLERAANELKELGRVPREQLSREGAAGAPGPKPLRDFLVDDRVVVWRGDDADDRAPHLVCTQMSVKRRQGKGITWTAAFGDRHENRQAQLARRNARLATGMIPGPGGNPSDPTIDGRRPMAPENVNVVVNPYAEGSITRAEQVITWDPVLYAVDDDGLPTTDPINIRGYGIFEHRVGQWSWITEVPSDQLTWSRMNVPVGARNLAVVAYSHEGYPSERSVDADGDVNEDAPPGGPGLIYDAAFLTQDVRDERAADAGAGFRWTFPTGKPIAEFINTTPVLNLGLGGRKNNRAGRVKVQANEKYLVGITAKRVGGTAATIRVRLNRFYDDGTSSSTNLYTSGALLTSDVIMSTLWTVPTGCIAVEYQLTGVGLTGGATVQAHTPILDRQTSNARLEDLAVGEPKLQDSSVIERVLAALSVSNAKVQVDAIIAANIHATNGITSKHTITGAVLQTHGASSTGTKMSSAGFFHYVLGGLSFSATSSGVYVKGELETGSGARFGGAGIADIYFASGYTIGTAGGSIEYRAGGSGHSFYGPVALDAGLVVGGVSTMVGAVGMGAALTVAGATALNAAAKVAGSGSTLGFYGATGSLKPTITGARASFSTTGALYLLLQALQGMGLLVNSTT